MFRIFATEAEESFIFDGFMSDEVESIPGGWVILYGELRKMREKKDFSIMTDSGDLKIKYSEGLLNAYMYYMNIWDNCRRWGLPLGGDWSENPPWLLSFLKAFDDVYVQIENYRIEKRRK